MNLNREQISSAAVAGLRLLELDTTLVPGNLRREIAVLEAILQGIASGQGVIVNPEALKVQSGVDAETVSPSDPEDEGHAEGE